ncbi:MAG: signal peptidase I [Actinomycetota bacterium]
MSREEVIAPAPQEATPSDKGGVLRFFKELPVLVALALGIALLIKAFLVQAFYIPSASMEPTLVQGDRVLVNKLSYRFGEPKRGDVVVFHDPYPDPCEATDGEAAPAGCERSVPRRVLDWFAEIFGLPTADTRDFIKRIVALPGETIQIENGQVYVCDEPDCVPLGPDGRPKDGRRIDFPSAADEGPRLDRDNVPAFPVPDDQYYVMGDNRANSSDSRNFRGIAREKIVGKAFVVVWPPNRFSGL